MPGMAATRSATTTRVTARCRTFPATPAHVGAARRYLAALMGGSPLAADAQLCLSELATNAIRHSRSALPGGSFTVCVQHVDRRWLIGVTDAGGEWNDQHNGEWNDHPNGDGLSNRGLAIVAALAARWRVDQQGRAGRRVWFQMNEGDGRA
jgi:serine/threonine-protein kinase RsbW